MISYSRLPAGLFVWLILLSAISGDRVGRAADPSPDIWARDNLVAWCIVPFDAKQRGPQERARMLVDLGIKRVAYDWRRKHVATFEQEILAYKEHGLEYFAFWNEHEAAFQLFKKHDLHPQIWKTCPSPEQPDQDARVLAAVRQLLPLVEKTRSLGCKLGLYNHGGWGGEPANLVAVCQHLRKHHAADHVGVVYNFHHAHDQIDNFAEAFQLVRPFLLCLNLNGMNKQAQPKIVSIGKGQHEKEMIRIVATSGYQGPIGILDHRNELDAEVSLRENLTGLRALTERFRKN